MIIMNYLGLTLLPCSPSHEAGDRNVISMPGSMQRVMSTLGHAANKLKDFISRFHYVLYQFVSFSL